VPLDHGTVFHAVDSPRVALGFSACGADVFLLDDEPNSSGGWNRTNVLLVQSQESHTSSDSPGIWKVNSLYRLRPLSSLFARRAQLLYQQQLPRSVCFQFGEEGSNLRLLIQSQAAYR
jgi:hypothetical protein